MVHAQQIKEEKLQENFTEPMMVMSGKGNVSHSRSNRYGHYKFRQRFSIHNFSNALYPKFNKYKVSNHNMYKEIVVYIPCLLVPMWVKNHESNFLAGPNS